MTHDEFRAAIESLWPGHGSQTRAAKHFSVNPRRIREYVSGAYNVPGWMAAEISDLLAMFPEGVKTINPRTAIAVLHQQMRQAGWTDSEAAAGILGASHALAVKHLGADETRTMLDAFPPDD